jgi:hypothetical protein
LHRTRGEADLVPDHSGSPGYAGFRPETLDSIRVFDLHARKCAAGLRNRLALALSSQQIFGTSPTFVV